MRDFTKKRKKNVVCSKRVDATVIQSVGSSVMGVFCFDSKNKCIGVYRKRKKGDRAFTSGPSAPVRAPARKSRAR